MSSPSSRADQESSSAAQTYETKTPTVAAFSPTTTSGYSASAKQRSTIIVHKKSPLLVATPPQVTRALAHSHPYLLPLNRLVGLASWSTDDPWESFLLLSAFWALTLYGGQILRYGGPIILVVVLILGMYSRRYSPLSSTAKTGEKHTGDKGARSEPAPQHKSLDEIVETVQQFTARCNLLLDPFLVLTDFLSTQTTATSATTRPALTTLFIRILLVTPVWIFLTLPPLRILTPRRIVLLVGTVVLSWHSRPAKITRVILWRSVFLRRLSALMTGLAISATDDDRPTIKSALSGRRKSQIRLASEIANKNRSSGVRFTFILYENQRRWIGLGWTTSLFSGERAPWTDEHLNPASPKDEFELPEVAGGVARWRWVEGSEWRIEGGDTKGHKRMGSKDSVRSSHVEEETDGGGWIYYDNKWDTGRKEDGWGRYCRRRKWYRDAELVEVVDASSDRGQIGSDDETPDLKIKKAQAYAASLNNEPKPNHDHLADSTATLRPASIPTSATLHQHSQSTSSSLGSSDTHFLGISASDKESSITSSRDHEGAKTTKHRRSGWFSRGRSDSKSSSSKNTTQSDRSTYSRDSKEDDVHDEWRDRGGGRIGFGEDLDMGLS